MSSKILQMIIGAIMASELGLMAYSLKDCLNNYLTKLVYKSKVGALIENELCAFSTPSGVGAFSLSDEELNGKREHLALTRPAYSSTLNSHIIKIASPLHSPLPNRFAGGPAYYPEKLSAPDDKSSADH